MLCSKQKRRYFNCWNDSKRAHVATNNTSFSEVVFVAGHYALLTRTLAKQREMKEKAKEAAEEEKSFGFGVTLNPPTLSSLKRTLSQAHLLLFLLLLNPSFVCLALFTFISELRTNPFTRAVDRPRNPDIGSLWQRSRCGRPIVSLNWSYNVTFVLSEINAFTISYRQIVRWFSLAFISGCRPLCPFRFRNRRNRWISNKS